MVEARRIRCPWCGERFEALVDASAGTAEYVEDCAVCCRPIVFHLDVDGTAGGIGEGGGSLGVSREE